MREGEEMTDQGAVAAGEVEESPPGLELVGVSKTLGDNLVVNDVSMKVDQGEMFTLLGSSGSGKTTTLNLIAGFLEPDAGEIYIRGTNMQSIPPERRGLGIVFQTRSEEHTSELQSRGHLVCRL